MALPILITRRVLCGAVVASVILAGASSALAQTAFSYQGVLKTSGAAYNGTADVRFTLYDSDLAGNVVGAPVEIIGTSVVNGLVTTELDFGVLAFDGSPRWIEIEVVTPSVGGGGSYTALSPRQPVTPAPYAMYAAVAGLVPDSALSGAYSNALSMTNAGNVFAGDGAGLSGLNADNITSGVIGDAQFGGTYSGVVSFTSGGNVFTGDGSGLFNVDWNNLASMPAGFADGIDNAGDSLWGGVSPGNIHYTNGSVGIGTSTPDGRLQITGGPTWTSNGWVKALNIPTVSAIELGGGGTTKYGIGSSLNGLYFFTTTTESASAPASYFMWTNSAGRVFMGNAATITGTSPLTVGGTGNDWVIYGQAGVNGIGVVGSQPSGNGRGVHGTVGAAGFCGVSGDHGSGAYGLLGTVNEGVYGNGGANGKIGVTGVSAGNTGVVGGASVGTSTAGVFGYSTASLGNGVIGEANTGTAAYGVWGRAAQGIGGYFTGGSYALVAAGKAKVNTIEIIGGSDLAEPFDVAQFDDDGSMRDIEPGMVVVIDPSNPGALMISSSAHDRKVAGIISGANDLAPGMVMKSEGGTHVDGDHPVALTGRVWCWCDAASVAIEPGDMLTTSDTPGHAMKAMDLVAAQGAIIGKAMTPLAVGERGLVLVLVNLQ